MKNKNKKANARLLATALIGVVVFLLNAGVVGAQTVFVDQECYEKYITQNDNYKICNPIDTKKEDCEKEAKRVQQLAKKNCEDTYGDSNKQVELQQCLVPIDIKFTNDMKKCTRDYKNAYESCNKLVDAQGLIECKDFSKYIKVIGEKMKADYGSITEKCYVDYLNKNISKCKTDNSKTTKSCVDPAISTRKADEQACWDTSATDLANCNKEKEAYKSQLCDSFEPGPDRDNCLSRNKNSISYIYDRCTSVENVKFSNCFHDSDDKYKAAEKICIDPDFLNKKDQECVNEIANSADLQCTPIEEESNICGNGNVEGDEECDDENTENGDGCDKLCKKEDVFRVADVLKIDEGQSYLDRSEGSDAKNSTSLKKGLIYIVIQFIELLTKIIGSLALLMVIVGGLILMISSGNSQLQQKGKRIIMFAILGLVIAFLSLVIVTTVQSLFYTT